MKPGTKRVSRISSIVHLKCPSCHEGNLFSVSNSYHFKTMLTMPDRCPVCHQDFKIEPGFYSGALWVSYPIVLVLLIPLSLTLLFQFQISIILALLFPLIMLFALQPLIMRFSRAIWINFFVSYKPRI